MGDIGEIWRERDASRRKPKKPAPKAHKCPDCGKRFKWIEALADHRVAAHGMKRNKT